MPEADYREPEYRADLSEVKGENYVMRKRGAEMKPPFADIFYYSDNEITFFFRAARFVMGEGDGEFVDNDEYVIDCLWKNDETLQYGKPNMEEGAQIQALDNIVDGLHYMWSGSKPPPTWVRVELRS